MLGESHGTDCPNYDEEIEQLFSTTATAAQFIEREQKGTRLSLRSATQPNVHCGANTGCTTEDSAVNEIDRF